MPRCRVCGTEFSSKDLAETCAQLDEEINACIKRRPAVLHHDLPPDKERSPT